MKIKCLRSDNGGEFLSNEFNNYCDKNAIKDIFMLQKHPKKMVLLKGKTELSLEEISTQNGHPKENNKIIVKIIK